MNDTKTKEELEAEKIAAEEAEALTPEEQRNLPMFAEMIKAGVIYGRKKSKFNPKMKNFVYTFRNGVALFDLSKVLEQIAKAGEFLRTAAQAGGKILIVATQPAAKTLAAQFAVEHGLLSVTERWLGGTLTNYKTMGARIEHFKKLKSDRAAGRHEKYTKKERLLLEREIAKCTTLFGGIEEMKELPKAMLVIDPALHETAVREARRVKVPIIALINSDGDPDAVQCLVPCNASAKSSIAWVMEYLGVALKEGKLAGEKVAAAKASQIQKVV